MAPEFSVPARIKIEVVLWTIFSTYLNPMRWWVMLRQVFFNDTAKWYAYLGDEFIEGRNQKFQNEAKPLWLNLGFWKDETTYDGACTALTRLLGEAANLQKDEEVLDVGFGYGDQDLIWQRTYDVRIVGLNITPLHVDIARARVEEKGLGDRIDFCVGSATDMEFAAESFDKVMALECAFHFDTREKFFAEAMRVLRPGGRLAVTDMLPSPGDKTQFLTSWVTRRRSGWPRENLYDRDVYVEKLRQSGFVNVCCESIRNDVYPGMFKYGLYRMVNRDIAEIRIHLTKEEIEKCAGIGYWKRAMGVSDYVVVTADKAGIRDENGVEEIPDMRDRAVERLKSG
jgi:microcystin synthetase protein McyJ